MKAVLLSLLALAPPAAHADEVRYVKYPAQALAAFRSVIADAKKSLDLTTFIFEPCHAGTQALLEPLAAKARQGVKVRVLLDAYMQSDQQKARLARYFADAGIELRWYNLRSNWDISTNFRSHAKLLLADGERYVSGGRNWADDYFGLYEGINFADRDVLVKGASGREALATFNELWNSRLASKPKTMSAPFKDWSMVCERDERSRVASVRSFLSAEGARILAGMPSRTCANVSFISDSPDFTHPGLTGDADPVWDNYMTPMRQRYKRATKAFLDFVNGTRKGAELENWSYIPVNYMQKAFDDLRAKRVPLHVITNSDMDGPGIIKHAEEYANNTFVGRHNRGSQTIIQLSYHGALSDAHALTPRESPGFRLHGKVGVRDGRDVMVGSFNIDPRSYATNIETTVEVKNCPALAGDLQQEFNRLRRIYVDDVKSGRVPPQEEPSFFAKVIAIIGINFL